MIKIKTIKQLGLFITWRLLHQAVCEKQLTEEDIIEYAIEKLEEGDDRNEICELAGAYNDEQDAIRNLLCKLARKENTQDSFEKRKIRAVIVYDVIKTKNDNYINGLMDLTDLWVGLGYPNDSPHIIQGRDNKIMPNEYYTIDNYDALYKRNVEWLKKELEYLRKNQLQNTQH